MVNKTVLSFLICFSLLSAEKILGQDAYYDALILGKYSWQVDPDENKYVFVDTNEMNVENLINILNKYFPGDTTYNQLNYAITGNPFFRLKESLTQSIDLSDISWTKKLSGTISSISGLDVTSFAFGMSDFLIDRAKEELTIAFFQRFEKFLEKYPEASTLFSQTSEFMKNMLAYEYTIWISTLREKFLDDLQNIPFRFDDVLELPKYEQVRKEIPEVLICLKIIETIQNATMDIQHQKYPADIIHEISELEAWKESDKQDTRNIMALFKTTDLISQSLRFYDTTVVLSAGNKDTVYQNSTCLIKKFTKNRTISYDTLQAWNENSMAWVTPRHIRLLLNDTVAFRIYLGLLYQEAAMKNIQFLPYEKSEILTDSLILNKGDILYANSLLKRKNINHYDTVSGNDTLKQAKTIYRGSILTYKRDTFLLKDWLSKYSDNIMGMRDLIETFNRVTASLDEVKDSFVYKKNHKIKLTKYDYKKYLSASFNTVNFGFDIVDYLDYVNEKSLTQYRTLSKELSNTIFNIYDDNYSEAISNASGVFKSIIDISGLNNEKDKKINDDTGLDSVYQKVVKIYADYNKMGTKKAEKIIAGKYDYPYEKSDKTPVKDFLKFSQKAVYYGSFMARMVEAKSSEEVQQVIATTALPAGSSSLKKYNRYNIALNAYLGGGVEFPSSKNLKTNFFLYAPVGISFTPFSMKQSGSFSIYGGLIDLGAVVNYRLTQTDTVYTKTDTLKTASKIVLGNIFSPSINVVYGFWNNIPLSLSVGFQYTPNLAKITGGDILTKQSYWRFNVTLTVDLPLYNIYPGKCRE